MYRSRRVSAPAWSACYLNGSGHTQFETFRMDPAAFSIGPMDMTDAALTAGIAVQEFASANDAYAGFEFE